MTARRSFLARLGTAAAAFGLGSSSAIAQEAAPPARPATQSAGRWQPTLEAKDDWLDAIPGKHRLIFDAVSPEGVASAIQFANNFFTGNKNGYGLEPADVAVVICLRHRATQFAFTDAIWAKHGAALAESEKFTDPKTNQAPTVNVYRNGLENHVKRGVHFAVCDLSSHRLARERQCRRRLQGSDEQRVRQRAFRRRRYPRREPRARARLRHLPRRLTPRRVGNRAPRWLGGGS